jgi:molybdopterin-binding protein
MTLSARNVLAGKVLEVKRGASTAHVRRESAGGAAIAASITDEAMDELGLEAGDQAYAAAKAST